MPYVPSKKTDGKSTDRLVISEKVRALAEVIADRVGDNLSLIEIYTRAFEDVACVVNNRLMSDHAPHLSNITPAEFELAKAIVDVGKKYDYQGAFLGEFNYSITRLIQVVPQIMVKRGRWQSELRYWLYAATVEALTNVVASTKNFEIGLSGVFEDIKDEYKRRVNTAYEAAQIVKSGDCYDTPYYTRLVEVIDSNGEHFGFQEVMLKKSGKTLNKDIVGVMVIGERQDKQ